MGKVVDVKVRFTLPDNIDEDLIAAAIIEYCQDELEDIPDRMLRDFGVKPEIEFVSNIS